ncbi:MAG: L-threonylcarbamoyladenylate synthase [Bacteroidales bacterium]
MELYSKDDLNSALSTLTEGGVILYPTDTIWGLGCDATRSEPVERIFRIKKRIEKKSLIILVNSFAMLERYVGDVPEMASQIIEVSDRPMTIIYPRGKNLAPGVCGEDGSVGVRICTDGFCNELITRFRRPVISTSSNYSDEPAPLVFSQINGAIISEVDYVVKYRQNDEEKHSPSSIIKFENDGSLKIIRQ